MLLRCDNCSVTMHSPLFICVILAASLSLCLGAEAETPAVRPQASRRVRNPQVIIRAVNTGKSISTSSSVSSSSRNNSAGPAVALALGQGTTTYPNPLYTGSSRNSPALQAVGNNGTSTPPPGTKSTRNR